QFGADSAGSSDLLRGFLLRHPGLETLYLDIVLNSESGFLDGVNLPRLRSFVFIDREAFTTISDVLPEDLAPQIEHIGGTITKECIDVEVCPRLQRLAGVRLPGHLDTDEGEYTLYTGSKPEPVLQYFHQTLPDLTYIEVHPDIWDTEWFYAPDRRRANTDDREIYQWGGHCHGFVLEAWSARINVVN
ncbi:hypothetical protein M422DRAFT_242766, partial [Sphaerobolus stellatus SS14]